MAETLPADPLLDANKPIRSTDIKQIRDAVTSIDGRVEALEDPSIRIFSHFAKRYGFTSTVHTFDDIIVGATAEAMIEGHDFYVANTNGSGSITNEIGQSATADDHFLRFETNATGHVIATAGMLFGRSSNLPITFRVRIRQSDNTNFFHYGLIGWTTGASLDDPASLLPTDPYIILNRNNATDAWRFSSYDGTTTTHGSDLTGLSDTGKISNNTWFEVKIIFTDDPSDKADCYIDNVLKETLTADLPDTQTLYAHVAHNNGADTMDLDLMEVSATGTLSDAT